MLIQWMAYASAFTILIILGAFALERAFAIWGMPRRFVWVAALIVAVAAPSVLALRPNGTVVHWTAALDRLPSSRTRANTPASLIFQQAALPGWAGMARIEPLARGGWATASFALLLFVATVMLTIHRRRRLWPETELDGRRVLLSPDAGPAVVGALRPMIVVPRWALSLGEDARELMLRHEAEHIAARDPHVFLAAVVALVVFPWNAGLWLIAQRLRLAIEVDCDARVLGRSARVREYGLLLVAVGARRSAAMPLAASLAARRPLLEQRIRAMTRSRPRTPRLASAFLALVAVLATTAATWTPRPAPLRLRARGAAGVIGRIEVPRQLAPASSSVATGDSIPRDSIRAVAARKRTWSDTIRTGTRAATARAGEPQPRNGPGLTVDEIRALLAAHRPEVLEKDATANLVTIVLDARGGYVTSGVERAPLAHADSSGAPGGSGEREGAAALAARQPKFVVDGREVLPIRSGALSTIGDLVEVSTIASVDVAKLGEGVIRPAAIGVVIIKLKA